MPDSLFLSYDVGTTNLKAALIDSRLRILGKKSKKYPVHIQQRGYAEQDPMDWWHAVVETTHELLQETNAGSKIVGVVFSGQTLSTVLINKDGEPLMRSLIWMDARAAPQAKRIIGRGPLKISGYNIFALLRFLWIAGGGPGLAGKDHIPRILWIKENMPDLYSETYKFLDSNGFMIHKATGQAVISRFDAHLTWLMNSRRGVYKWSNSIINKYGIDKEKLPKIMLSTEVAGNLTRDAASELNLPQGIPVIVGAGDVASVAVGSGAVREKEYFAYIGTSDFMGTHIPKRKTDISHFMASISSAIPDLYLYIGEQETAGTCLDWVKNEFFKDIQARQAEEIYDVIDRIADHVPLGSGGLMFAPWLSGEKTPVDDHIIRGGFYNMSLEHGRDNMVRAVMEGVAFNMRWAFRCMENKLGDAQFVNFVGGGAKSDVWCQIVSDVLNRKIKQTENPAEAGVRGAAMIASVALGVHKNFATAARYIGLRNLFSPNIMNARLYDRLFVDYKMLYRSTKTICRDLNLRRSA